jgi:hypothetical protein
LRRRRGPKGANRKTPPNDADARIDKLTDHGLTPVILPKAGRKDKRECDFALYCERNLIERFFNKVKHFPRHRNALRQTGAKLSRRSSTEDRS